MWLFVPAFLLHILEERPSFTNWASAHGSPGFSQRDYNRIHAAGLFVALLFPALLSAFPARALTFLFVAFVLAPSTLFNALFHAGASLITRSYCPGVATAVILYIPLFCMLVTEMRREYLLSSHEIAAAVLIAAAFHAWEVGHNVFRAW